MIFALESEAAGSGIGAQVQDFSLDKGFSSLLKLLSIHHRYKSIKIKPAYWSPMTASCRLIIKPETSHYQWGLEHTHQGMVPHCCMKLGEACLHPGARELVL